MWYNYKKGDMMNVPKKITPDLIVEAIVELRFNSNTPADAIFGIVYNSIKDEYKEVEKLPILQLPEEIRANDPNLIFKPYYKLASENFILQIGPRVISIASYNNNYCGWKTFNEEIQKIFKKTLETNVISEPQRLGVRYINFFERTLYGNIFSNINLSIQLNNAPLNNEETVIRTVFDQNNFITNLQIVSKAQMLVKNTVKDGSIVDIDTFTENKDSLIANKLHITLENGHSEEKIIFFGLLNADCLNKLIPQY